MEAVRKEQVKLRGGGVVKFVKKGVKERERDTVTMVQRIGSGRWTTTHLSRRCVRSLTIYTKDKECSRADNLTSTCSVARQSSINST